MSPTICANGASPRRKRAPGLRHGARAHSATHRECFRPLAEIEKALPTGLHPCSRLSRYRAMYPEHGRKSLRLETLTTPRASDMEEHVLIACDHCTLVVTRCNNSAPTSPQCVCIVRIVK